MLAMLVSAVTASADDISLGDPIYGGTGCPDGTASATLSPDAKSLTILFDQYVAEAGGSTGKTLDRKSCNVAIPVHIPQGFSVSIIAVDFRGFNSIPSGAMSEINAEYFFAGMKGPRFTRRFFGPLQDEYLFNNTLQATAVVWSPCGEDVILRTNSSMLARTNMSKQQTMATVDSMDVDSGIIYQLQWRSCN